MGLFTNRLGPAGRGAACSVLAVLCLISTGFSAGFERIMLRPEFGPMHVTRFHLQAFVDEQTHQSEFQGYKVKLYQVGPRYQDLGTFVLSSTDKPDAFALMIPPSKISYGQGDFRMRLYGMKYDGSEVDLGAVECPMQRVLLRGIRPLRVEWELHPDKKIDTPVAAQ